MLEDFFILVFCGSLFMQVCVDKMWKITTLKVCFGKKHLSIELKMPPHPPHTALCNVLYVAVQYCMYTVHL